MTLNEKIEIIGGINDFFTRPLARLGIPALKMSDGPMGVHDYGLTTAYPADIALAASWDTQLAERFGASMGKDALARGVHFILAPGMNIYRAPMNGRNFEYFGEDPFLASRIAVATIKGIQAQRVIATAKHFAGNNSEFARMTLSSDIDERTLREIYLPAFEFGFFDQPQTDTDITSYSQEGRQVALEEARGGMVLLKNSGNLLPLDERKLKTVAVIGPDAFPAVPGGGGSAETKPFNAVSYLEGISNRLGTKARVLYAVDTPPLDEVFENSEFVTAPDGESGLKGEYFSNEDLPGAPVLTRTDKHVHFDWGEGSFAPNQPVDHFSVRWTGYFVPKKTGDYKFFTSADDGVRLYLGDDTVIDDWQRHSQTVDSYITHLEGGHAYKLRLEYFEAVGSAIVGFGVTEAEASIGRETKALAAKADAAIIFVGSDPKTESEGSDRTFQLPGVQDELIRQIIALKSNTILLLTAAAN